MTQVYPPSAMYCLTPVGGVEAPAVARRNWPEPVSRDELAAPATVNVLTSGTCSTRGNSAHPGEYDDVEDPYYREDRDVEDRC